MVDAHSGGAEEVIQFAIRRSSLGLILIASSNRVSAQEIVQKVGRSKTAQEVAEACGANPVAVIVPCHRVIRSDGSLAGYRWGLKRKRALLEREQEAVPEPGSLFHAGHSQRFISL